MKKSILLISIVALSFLSCKKDHLTKEELQEELANNQHDYDLPNWQLLETYNKVYNHQGTNYNFWTYVNNKATIEGYNLFETSWRNNHHEVVINLDTTGLGFQNYNNIISTPNIVPYLNQMYSANKFYDVLEVIEVTNDKAIFYSKELQEFILTEKQ